MITGDSNNCPILRGIGYKDFPFPFPIRFRAPCYDSIKKRIAAEQRDQFSKFQSSYVCMFVRVFVFVCIRVSHLPSNFFHSIITHVSSCINVCVCVCVIRVRVTACVHSFQF